ncbi:sporulation protein [Streptosporangium sp. NPDC001559]|uniref:sporulation protein n=1 Tax=Streptosporangium sp. NPDC001559 TaxID=3366187 RepID=UPI0036EE5A5D
MKRTEVSRASEHPNVELEKLIVVSGISHKALAARVNQHCAAMGKPASYTHTSIANWISGMIPRWPAPQAIAAALSERLGHPVSVTEIGMPQSATTSPDIGLDFPRDLPAAIDTATAWWVLGDRMNRREFNQLTFAAATFTTPVTRWLIQPSDPSAAADRSQVRRVGAADIAELHEAAEHARRIDSKYGGLSSGSTLTACLRERAVPLLKGTYSDAIGRRLFAVTAQLGRLAGYSAWDLGHQARAQRHYIQALRLARAAGDVPLGGYALASMSLQAGLNGFCEDAVDMAQGAFERTRHNATPRTLAFFKLVEARAHARAARLHGRAHAGRAAGQALAQAETLLGQARPSDDDPDWIDFFTYPRLAADATEIHRDLRMPHMVMRFEALATMPADTYTRSCGMRNAIVGSAHLHAHHLDEGLQYGHRAVDILSQVASIRSLTYVKDLLEALQPWKAETRVQEFHHRVRRELRVPA